jgi:DNA-binding transcriptional MerR regulator
MAKSLEAFRTIGEVSDDLDVPKHVLRFWEGRFPQLKPMKRGGGRRFYRPEDVELLKGIHHLLHNAGYTIKGVQKILRDQGVEAVKALTVAPEVSLAAAARSGASVPPAKAARSQRPTATNKTAAQIDRTQLAAIANELAYCISLARGQPMTNVPMPKPTKRRIA